MPGCCHGALSPPRASGRAGHLRLPSTLSLRVWETPSLIDRWKPLVGRLSHVRCSYAPRGARRRTNASRPACTNVSPA
jgi:hypothetical protein